MGGHMIEEPFRFWDEGYLFVLSALVVVALALIHDRRRAAIGREIPENLARWQFTYFIFRWWQSFYLDFHITGVILLRQTQEIF
jgi:hypothetical protein